MTSTYKSKPKVVATIEARMSSSRLPGKTLRPIVGKPMLELLIERLQRAKTLDEIVVATTTNPADGVIEDLAAQLKVRCYRGSEEDVLDRVLRAAQSAQGDVIVEITGDCPLMDPGVIDQLVDLYLTNSFDYVSNSLKRTYPIGFDVKIFSTSVLDEVERTTNDPADREHVSLYIYEHPERFSLKNVESGLQEKHWDLRLTVDTQDDFNLVTAIYEAIYPADPAFGMHDIVAFLDRHQDLAAMNKHVQQKAAR